MECRKEEEKRGEQWSWFIDSVRVCVDLYAAVHLCACECVCVCMRVCAKECTRNVKEYL